MYDTLNDTDWRPPETPSKDVIGAACSCWSCSACMLEHKTNLLGNAACAWHACHMHTWIPVADFTTKVQYCNMIYWVLIAAQIPWAPLRLNAMWHMACAAPSCAERNMLEPSGLWISSATCPVWCHSVLWCVGIASTETEGMQCPVLLFSAVSGFCSRRWILHWEP